MKYKGFEEVRRCWMTLIGTLFLGLLGGRQARRMVSIIAIEKQIEGEKEERMVELFRRYYATPSAIRRRRSSLGRERG